MQKNHMVVFFAGADFQDAKITTGGDQLTRVNLDSAKMLRLGAHTAKERFENLTPVIEELFHVQQDLLEVGTGTPLCILNS